MSASLAQQHVIVYLSNPIIATHTSHLRQRYSEIKLRALNIDVLVAKTRKTNKQIILSVVILMTLK